MASLKISQLPLVTTSSGSDLYPLVQAGVNDAITFVNLQSAILGAASAAPYAPAAPSHWAGTPPTTIQQALDRIAAVVGAVTPIP